MAKLTKDYNLAALYPDIAKEWHPTKNGELTPDKVTPGSAKKVWFKCKKGHSWDAQVLSRAINKSGCRYCSGKFVGYGNDLQTLYPEIAKEWHPTKNGDLKPSQVHHGSLKRIWWQCKKGHEWATRVHRRTGTPVKNCRFCSSSFHYRGTSKPELYLYAELQSIFNNVHHRKQIRGLEIDIFIEDINLGIEYDGAFFHQKRLKKDKMKKDKIKTLGIDLINLRERPLKKIYKSDIVITSKQNLHKTSLLLLSNIKRLENLSNKQMNAINRYLLDDKQKNEVHYKKLVSYLPGPLPEKSIQYVAPHLVEEWHPTKNGSLTPGNTSANSLDKIWWICKRGHEYRSRPNSRISRKTKCPFCKNRKVGYGNDLQSKFPEIAKEWHPTKNGDLKPSDIVPGYAKKVWLLCEEGHSWQAIISNRLKSKSGCLYCSNKKVGYGNDLQTLYPEIAKEWHPTKNGDLKPNEFVPGSDKRIWWQCKKGHEWATKILKRTDANNKGCKKC